MTAVAEPRQTTALDLKTQDIPSSEIFVDPDFNCRGPVDPSSTTDLARDIASIGLKQAITIQPYDKKPPFKYRVVAGNRRFTAMAKVLKWETIPSVIEANLTEVQARVINLSENLKRKDLNILQEAKAIKRLKDYNLSFNEVAKELQVSSGWVQVRFNLLDLPIEIQQEAAAGLLTQGQIKQVWSLPTKEQRFEAVKLIKDSRLRGEKVALTLRPKTKKNIMMRSRRGPDEIIEMITHIEQNLGMGLATRALAWSVGNISSLDFYRDIKAQTEKEGKRYEPPDVPNAFAI